MHDVRREDDLRFLDGGGEMGALIRAHDWSASPLGRPATWPQSLRTAVRLLLQTGHPMYIFWGPEHICFYNDAYRPSIGTERHPGSLGQRGSDVWAEIWDTIGPQIEQVMAGRGATWHENQLIPTTRNGVRQDIYWTYSYGPIDDENAPTGVGGVLVVCTETTAQVSNARKLAESEERLQLALSAGGGIGTWDWDVPNDRVVADRHFARLYGVDPERAKAGAPIGEFFKAMHPDDLARLQIEIAQSLKEGREFNSEYRLIQPDGSVIWAAARGRCIQADDGTPLRFPGMSFDITARKTAETRSRALLDLDDRFRSLEAPADISFAAAEILGRALDVSRAGYGTVDIDAETITIERDWNAPGIKSLAGVLAFRDYGSYIEDLKRGDTVIFADAEKDPRTAAGADKLKAISAQSAINMPVTEGKFVALLYLNHATARAWPDDELVFIRDVAQRTRMAVERRRAEQKLRDLLDSLETEVVARTEALMRAEETLRQSQKMEAVGQLTGGLAHDFNNLLTGISGSMEMMQARISQGRFDTLDRYITAAQGAVKRAAALTHRLLAFSRRQTLDPKPTNVNRLVAGMEDLIRRTAGPEVAVEVVGAAGLWSTLVDPNQLENALLNLCINARDAMPDGGRLTIETANKWLDDRSAKERDLSPGQYLSLCVTDTGTGMTPDVISRAFDPFFTTKPLGQGTGLGLSMIYGFARQSGGQVRIYSEEGKGTTMCLYLPRHDKDAELEGAAFAAAYNHSGDGEVVLVIDDEPTIRMLIAEVLEENGYSALEASDGQSGLRVLQSSAKIDLLITDVGLPGGMNGRQIADAARVLRPDLKVLFITGYAENAAVGNGFLEKGMQVVTKPFAMDGLAKKIRDMIEG